MAVNDAWEMAVALPIKNNKFKYYKTVNTTFSIAYSSPGESEPRIVVNSLSEVIGKEVRKGDSIILGDSSYSGYIGQSESNTIKSISVVSSRAYITLVNALENKYSIGDNVVIYGTKLAGGWSVVNSDYTFPQKIDAYTSEFIGGKVDEYVQHVIFDFDELPTNQNNISGQLRYSFTNNPFLRAIHYRIGMWYKAYVTRTTGQTYAYIFLNDGKGTRASRSSSNITSDTGTWTELTSGDSSKVRMSSITQKELNTGYFSIVGRGFDANDDINLYIDCVYAEHAHGISPITELSKEIPGKDTTHPAKIITSLDVISNENFTTGEYVIAVDLDNEQYGIGVIASLPDDNTITLEGIMWFYMWDSDNNTYTEKQTLPWNGTFSRGCRVQQANKGYYQFSEKAIQNSVGIENLNVLQTNKLSDGSETTYYNSDGSIGDRFKLTARFENVPQAMWEKLMVFDRYQKAGNLLNLHPKFDELPAVMTGRMKITNVSKTYWDLTYRNFTFTFTESY